MLVPEMFSDHGMFMFFYAWMEVAASVQNIICIAQMTCELICYTFFFSGDLEIIQSQNKMASNVNGHLQRKVTKLKSKFLYILG